MSSLNGLVNFNKPAGISSARAMYRVRSILRAEKAGHAGTLDPAACGVLLILLGKGTKLAERIMDLPKEYRATARLDVTSASHDSDEPMTPIEVARPPTEDEVRQALSAFEGTMEQTPPSFSALKIGGKPAYKLAAKGKPVKLAARPVHIYRVQLLAYRWPQVKFEARCGRGTYVRAIVRDLGARLATGGCLISLTRTWVGPFGVDHAATFDDLRQGSPTDHLLSLERAMTTIAEARERAPGGVDSTVV